MCLMQITVVERAVANVEVQRLKPCIMTTQPSLDSSKHVLPLIYRNLGKDVLGFTFLWNTDSRVEPLCAVTQSTKDRDFDPER